MGAESLQGVLFGGLAGMDPKRFPGFRRYLPHTREAWVTDFDLNGMQVTLRVGIDEAGAPREVFLDVGKEGSTLSGLLDSLAVAISLGLQYGIPLEKFVDKFEAVRFEPMGHIGGRFATSLVDQISHILRLRFLGEETKG